jgi:RNA polymerase sigma factor (sigma-70 family)
MSATDIFNNDVFSSSVLVPKAINNHSSKTKKDKKKSKPKKEKNIQKLATNFINDPSEMNFNLLCERINWGLRSHIFKIVGSDDATTEVLSKTLENIYFKRNQFNPEIAQFSTWMYKIALNNSLKYLQEKNSNSHCVNVDFEDLYDSTVYGDEDEDTSPDQGSGSYTSATNNVDIIYDNNKYVVYDRERVISEFYDASVKCIDYLPDNLRIVMRDKLVNQKKIDNIAYDNNIPVTSVKNWLRKGKTELQSIIKDKYTDLYNMYMEMSIA